MDVLRTDAHVNFLADVAVGNELLQLALGDLNRVVAEYSVNAVAALGQLNSGRSSSAELPMKPATNRLHRIVVQVLRSINLLDEAVLHNDDAGSPWS